MCLRYHNILIRPCRLPTLQNGADLWQSQKRLWPLQNNFVTIYLQKYLLLSQNDFVNIILLRSQNLFCKTNKAFWIYLTKYFVSSPNPDNRIRVTRFQQPGTRFLNRVISQLTSVTKQVAAFSTQRSERDTIRYGIFSIYLSRMLMKGPASLIYWHAGPPPATKNGKKKQRKTKPG